MLTVICVLRSGGIYSADWVRKLRDAVARNLSISHRFVCLSDVEVPCERIPLAHNWPGWWAKLELFKPGVVTGPTLYLDLDTVIVGNIDALANIPTDFAMLRNFGRRNYIGSGVMWLGKPQVRVYERFIAKPEEHIAEYIRNEHAAVIGDQAFIFDTIGDTNVTRLQDVVPGLIHCYPKTFAADQAPAGAGVICFKGKIKPPQAMHLQWCLEAWV